MLTLVRFDTLVFRGAEFILVKKSFLAAAQDIYIIGGKCQ